jgi:hypothetical protein
VRVEKFHYLVNHIVFFRTFNREAAQFPENKTKWPFEQFGLAEVFGMR